MVASTWHGTASARAMELHEVTPPFGSPTSLHLPGSDPLRVLLFGDGPAVGFTVTSHELALAGHLARTLQAQTGRGVVVDIRSDSRMSTRDALHWARRIDLTRYDAIVVTLGTHDAIRHTATRQWATGMRQLLEHFEHASCDLAPIAVGTIPDLSSLRTTPVPRRIGARSHADMLNLALRSVPIPVSTVIVELTVCVPSVESPSVRRQRWARDLVTALGPLRDIRPRTTTDSRRAERRRQESLRRTGVLSTPCPPQLDEIVGTAQRTFSVPGSALNFIDDSQLWVAAARGMATDPVRRVDSICDHTIRDSRTLVVPDASTDQRFSANPFVSTPGGVRFYAGHPVESPDGERIGSLCLFDGGDRTFTRDDTLMLQELAFRVQNELYALA